MAPRPEPIPCPSRYVSGIGEIMWAGFDGVVDLAHFSSVYRFAKRDPYPHSRDLSATQAAGGFFC